MCYLAHRLTRLYCERRQLEAGLYLTWLMIQRRMSRVMRKPAFCICQNKGAYQLRSNCAPDLISCAVTSQLICALCFRYIDSTTHLLPKSSVLSLQPSSVDVQPSFCWTWSNIPKTGFLTMRLRLSCDHIQICHYLTTQQLSLIPRRRDNVCI